VITVRENNKENVLIKEYVPAGPLQFRPVELAVLGNGKEYKTSKIYQSKIFL